MDEVRRILASELDLWYSYPAGPDVEHSPTRCLVSERGIEGYVGAAGQDAGRGGAYAIYVPFLPFPDIAQLYDGWDDDVAAATDAPPPPLPPRRDMVVKGYPRAREVSGHGVTELNQQ